MTVTHPPPGQGPDLLAVAAAIAAANTDDIPDCERAERLTKIAWELLGAFTEATTDTVVHARLAELRGAAQATVAAADEGACDPLVYLRHVLARHDWLPAPGTTSTPRRILAAAPFGTGPG